MIDVLVVAHATVLRVNRSFYCALSKRAWKIEFAIPDKLPFGGLVEPRGDDEPPIHWLTPIGRNTRYWRFGGLEALVRRTNPRIVFLENEPDSRMAYELGGIARAIGAKLVCVTNENDLPPPLAALSRGDLRAALRSGRSRLFSLAVRNRVDHVLAICDDGVTAMNALGFAGRVTKMPLGFDPSLFVVSDRDAREAVRRRLALAKPTVAYFGRLVEKKGVHILIEALARIREFDWQFLIDDVEEDDAYAARLMREIGERGLTDRTVQFHATHAEMPAIMNAADIVVAPSIWKEQYGRVVPEAMACGRAVVVSDIGAMPELLDDCGVKVPPGDVDALADAIRRLLEDASERARLGRLAAERASAVLSLQSQVDIVDRLLRELAPRGAAGIKSASA